MFVIHVSSWARKMLILREMLIFMGYAVVQQQSFFHYDGGSIIANVCYFISTCPGLHFRPVSR
ncbi:hypothetical protein LINPERPRIM_LOCUS30967, partial [Linum perenne]